MRKAPKTNDKERNRHIERDFGKTQAAAFHENGG